MKAIAIMLFVLLLSFIHCPTIMAQKWGKVTQEELDLKSIPEDPEADAVVLFDIGSMSITVNFELKLTRHCRIKILTERGKKYADVSISYWHEDLIKKLKAQTIQPDGKKVELDKKNIFEERTEFWKSKVFSMPAIEIGSIIEYEYEKSSEYLTFLEPWYFQNEEFTKFSQLTVMLPAEFSYNCFFNNIVSFDPEKEKTFDPDRPQRYLYKFTWKKENVPALKAEPYMTTLKDYRQSIYFQLIAYNDPPYYYQFAKSWDDLAKIARERFDELFTNDKSLKATIAQILPDSIKGIDRIEAIYNYLTRHIETTDDRGLMGDGLKKTSQVINDEAGSAVEKNLLLINLLRMAGLAAQPVLISTRHHGRFQENWIQLQQFDHLLVHLKADNRSYFLDTESKFCPFSLLPSQDLVGSGLLVENDVGRIIPIPVPPQLNMKYAGTQAVFNEADELHCHSIIRFEGYRGLEEREQLSEEKPDDYVKNMLNDRFSPVVIDSFKVHHLELVESPLTIEIDYHVPNYAQVVGNMIYLSPALLNRLKSNPFKRPTRNFPVEFNYTISSTEDVELMLPRGYQVMEAPQPTGFGIPGLRFMTTCTVQDNKIQYSRHFSISKLTFEIQEYASLRNAYEQVVSADQAQVVIKRPQ